MSDFLKGRNFVIVPRVTTIERNALTATNGMLVYDTDLNAFYKYENGAWGAFAGGSAAWGSITGTLSNQTDLQNALNAKQNTLTNPVTGTGTNNEIAAFNSTGSTITSLATTTYPTLTELSYVKGVTSAIQAQLGKCLYITTGNQTTTSDTAQDITGLSVTLLANTRYKIHGFIRFGVNNTGGTKFAATIPSGSLDIALFGVGSTTTSFTRSLLTSSGTLSAITFLNTNSTNGWVFVDGEVSVGVTGGTFQFQFASGTATQTSTINQLGTEIHVTQLV